ncbi:LacI family transcriptional regulator [Lichenibacterium ramalinae]|uniref:LacI family transcriptional regulator n=1 Tax=Lichenibacterium ramalinae TaxID=2316527 RepID=A0A4Q2RER5_9HYPH|nr:LacI family transcriptional regulator [Lichenibacterium ramalinae]
MTLREGVKRPSVRLRDVAERARCSAATVSRVLNAPETVNREARLRVEAAVRDLGYTRNGAARALRSRRSQIVGLILPTLKQTIYADFIGAVQDALEERDYALIVASSDYSPERELFQARLMAERGIDGLMLVGLMHRPDLHALLDAQSIPYVTTYTFRQEADHPVMGFDNVASMASIVDHLVELGHRDIAVLAGRRRDSDRAEDRIRGVAAALARHGLDFPDDHTVEETLSIPGGREGLRRLLAAGPLPTALVCASDVLAYGALVECQRLGIAVPADLSVVGCDDLPASKHILPALTTLAIPAEEMGRRAAAYLLSCFAGSPHAPRMCFDTRLMVRQTTAPPSRAPRPGATAP